MFDYTCMMALVHVNPAPDGEKNATEEAIAAALADSEGEFPDTDSEGNEFSEEVIAFMMKNNPVAVQAAIHDCHLNDDNLGNNARAAAIEKLREFSSLTSVKEKIRWMEENTVAANDASRKTCKCTHHVRNAATEKLRELNLLTHNAPNDDDWVLA